MNKKLIYIIVFIIILIGFFFWKNMQKKEDLKLPINVISTTPKNDAVFVSEGSEVVIVLNRPILNTESENLKVEINPSTKVNIVYLENKIRISPETEFDLDTKYQIKVVYDENLIYSLNFETNPFTKEQIETEGAKQTEADLAFNESYSQFLRDFPWYRKIPIEKADYTVVYDFDLKSFRIIMNRVIKDETDREIIVKNVISDLTKIGVKPPINNYVFQEIN